MRLQFSFIVAVFLFSYNSRSQNIEAFVTNKSWDTLASDSLKIDRIYHWITNHIKYDTERAFERYNKGKQNSLANQCFEKRVGVCIGYASLFKKMCDILNVPCIIIEGESYNQNYSEINKHAWVAFKIKNQWYLADPTWDAGYVENGSFYKTGSRKYFMMPPNKFISKHYPFDPCLQLLETPIYRDSFIVTAPLLDTQKLRNQSCVNQLYNTGAGFEALRSHQYDPTNPYIEHTLALNYMDSASNIIGDCIIHFNQNKLNNSKQEKCIEKAERAISVLKKAEHHLTSVNSKSESNREMSDINLSVVKQNILTLRQLIESLGKRY